jgi:hypothetical protein
LPTAGSSLYSSSSSNPNASGAMLFRSL